MASRQQSAVEFLTTYSFAILMISIMLVAAMSISFSLGSTPPIYSTCSIQPLLTCQRTLLTYTTNSLGNHFTFILMFRNNLGFFLRFPANAINLTVTGLSSGSKVLSPGTCTPALSGQGSQVLCKVTISGTSNLKQGADTYTQFHIYYNLCTSPTNALSCSPSNVTGYSYQTLSPPSLGLYNLTVSSPNGIVVINGQPYFDNSIVYLITGTYTLYAQPSGGYTFNGWSSSGGASLANALVSNTILTMNSNGNVLAYFTG